MAYAQYKDLQLIKVKFKGGPCCRGNQGSSAYTLLFNFIQYLCAMVIEQSSYKTKTDPFEQVLRKRKQGILRSTTSLSSAISVKQVAWWHGQHVWFTLRPLRCVITRRSAAALARALRHLANITAIKDGGCRSVDRHGHGSIWTHLLRTQIGQIALKVDTQRNTGILRRPHNYLCFVHVCTQLGCYGSTLDRPRSAQIGVEWNPWRCHRHCHRHWRIRFTFTSCTYAVQKMYLCYPLVVSIVGWNLTPPKRLIGIKTLTWLNDLSQKSTIIIIRRKAPIQCYKRDLAITGLFHVSSVRIVDLSILWIYNYYTQHDLLPARGILFGFAIRSTLLFTRISHHTTPTKGRP